MAVHGGGSRIYVDPVIAVISLVRCVKISVKLFVPSRLTPSESVRPDDIPSSGLLGDCGDVERS